ncbi:MAG: zinc-binding dehydrogenase, partial [Planctomycetota bacterium]|nr:zinc-binding dehydrogenase [Planctomycetota bacterium]
IVILGDGRLGQLVARVFRARGLSPTVIGRVPAKLDLVRRLGLMAVGAEDAEKALQTRDVPRPVSPGRVPRTAGQDPPWHKAGAGDRPEAAQGSGKTADVVVEATGTADGLAMALGFVRPRGTIVLKSTVADTAGLDLAPLVVDEVTVVGSRCGPMDEAMAMLAEADLDLEPLITAEYPLTEADAAVRAAADPEAIKVLIRP